MDGEPPWRGLWHPSAPGRARDEMVVRAVAYFVTPLALALLFGEIHSIHQFAGGYIGSFIVGTPIAVTFELLYRLAWTRIVRKKPSWPARIAGHIAIMAIAVAAGGLIANVTGRAFLGWS